LAIFLLVFTASDLHHWYIGHCLACLYDIWLRQPKQWPRY
jgi:predicted alpha-1,6-mannanase (GH76 family)